MKNLPIDERGYPVPWFVEWINGKPEFRAMDGNKFLRAVRYKRCWICGDALGRYLTFVAGPMCGINQTSAEPPSHLECARYSALNCPFLNNPDAIRRIDEQMPMMNDETPGFHLMRNPGVAMLWTCRDYAVFDDGKGKPLIHMGEPSSVEWYAKGIAATREQVLASIDSGMPALMAIARTEPGAVQELQEARARFEKYLPLT
jgi:hypothetical protein